MNTRLQTIMIVASLIFLLYIIIMVRSRKLELKYTLAWFFTGLFLLIVAVFPRFLSIISGSLHIVEPVNTLFLLVIFFLMLILLTLTIALSRSSSRVKTLIQEIAIIKLELEKFMRNASKLK